jgi:hypothetical protein
MNASNAVIPGKTKPFFHRIQYKLSEFSCQKTRRWPEFTGTSKACQTTVPLWISPSAGPVTRFHQGYLDGSPETGDRLMSRESDLIPVLRPQLREQRGAGAAVRSMSNVSARAIEEETMAPVLQPLEPTTPCEPRSSCARPGLRIPRPSAHRRHGAARACRASDSHSRTSRRR